MCVCTIRKATVPQIQHYLMPVLMLNTGRTGRGGFLHCFPINVLIPSMLASNVGRQSDSWNSWVLNSAQKSRVVSAVDIARAQESVQSKREWEGIPTVRVKCDKYLNATLCRAFMFIQQLALLFMSMPMCVLIDNKSWVECFVQDTWNRFAIALIDRRHRELHANVCYRFHSQLSRSASTG